MQQETIIDTRTSLDTPEGVQLTFHLAGPALRMVAYLVDVIIRFVIVLFFGLTITISGLYLGLGRLGLSFWLILAFLGDWFYGAMFEWLWSGRTPGKRMFNLRVLKDGGYPIGLYEAVIRNFLRTADAPAAAFFGLGVITMMSTRRLQRMGDLFAGTMVVVEQPSRVPHKPRNLNMVPILERVDCRRGYHVSERTLDIVTRLFERSGYLSGPRREAIATVLAEPIADRLGFDLHALPPEDRGSRFLIRVIKTFSPTETERPKDDFSFLDANVDEKALLAGARE